MATHSSILAWNLHEQRNLEAPLGPKVPPPATMSTTQPGPPGQGGAARSWEAGRAWHCFDLGMSEWKCPKDSPTGLLSARTGQSAPRVGRQVTAVPHRDPGQTVLVCSVAQSCPTLCNRMDCSLPDSSIRGILQTRILEWLAMPSFKGSS